MSESNPEFGEIDWDHMEHMATHDESGAPAFVEPALELSVEMVQRRVLWDTVPCQQAVEVAKYLELPATSDDVETMEHTQSHVRLLDVAVLRPLVLALADASARSITGAMVVAGGDKDHLPLTGEVYTDMYEKLQPVIYMSSLSMLAELVDIGVVHMPHMVYLGGPEDEVGEP